MTSSTPFPSTPTLILDNGAHSIKALYSNQSTPSYAALPLSSPVHRAQLIPPGTRASSCYRNAIVRSKTDKRNYVADELDECTDFGGLVFRMAHERVSEEGVLPLLDWGWLQGGDAQRGVNGCLQWMEWANAASVSGAGGARRRAQVGFPFAEATFRALASRAGLRWRAWRTTTFDRTTQSWATSSLQPQLVRQRAQTSTH